jgi:predicted secreted protein
MTSVVAITKQDAGRTICVSPGQRVVLELEDISSTGYRWDFSPPDGSVLSLEANEFLPRPGIGGGGIRRLTYRVVNPGQYQISLHLKRPWETSSIDQFQAFITAAS